MQEQITLVIDLPASNSSEVSYELDKLVPSLLQRLGVPWKETNYDICVDKKKD